MMQASDDIAEDDITVRCRVRRAEISLNPDFGEPQDVICTMRNTKRATALETLTAPLNPVRTSSDISKATATPTFNEIFGLESSGSGKELFLRPVRTLARPVSPFRPPSPFNSDSFGSIPDRRRNRGRSVSRSSAGSRGLERVTSDTNRSRGRLPKHGSSSSLPPLTRDRSVGRVRMPTEPRHHSDTRTSMTDEAEANAENGTHSIPLNEIVLVDLVTGDNGEPGKIMNISTKTCGYFEFEFANKNAHDVLWAVLQTSIPSERITIGLQQRIEGGQGTLSQHVYLTSAPTEDTNCTSQSFDMDNFTAKEMTERVKKEKETISDRWRLRTQRYMSRLSDFTRAFTDCACGGCEDIETPAKDKVVPAKSSFIDTEKQEGRPRLNTSSTELIEDGGSSSKNIFSVEDSSPVTLTTNITLSLEQDSVE